ncbi:hypothetical protein MKZ25_18415 [Solibacillus sp. FSL W7-1464]|uniref:hypothetical protein n=1 Tax=Solibacillus sp. FSL W7-1464 TaxID=2921706 RepID=UPI0030F7591B
MRKQSKYKMIKLELADDSIIEPQNLENFGDGRALISKAVLEDTEGRFYSVSPNQNGLRFTMGELTYKEYRKKEKNEDLKGISFLALLIGLTLTIMYLSSIFLL